MLKKASAYVVCFLLLCCIGFGVWCLVNKPDENSVGDVHFKETTYAITFYNYDGSIFEVVQCAYGTMPKVNRNPTRAAEGSIMYVFDGWTPILTAVDGEASYTAVFVEKRAIETEPMPL